MRKKAIRAEGQTQVSISLEQQFLEQIDARAKAEHRTRSNFIVHVIKEYLEKRGVKFETEVIIAEDPAEEITTVLEEKPTPYRTKKRI